METRLTEQVWITPKELLHTVSVWKLAHGHLYHQILVSNSTNDDTGSINFSSSLKSLSESLVKIRHLSEYEYWTYQV